MNQPVKSSKAGPVAAVLTLAAGLVSYYEGYSPTGYADPVNIPTACTGHTGRDVVVGKRYTPEQCSVWLDEDLREAALAVDRCITSPMQDYQWAALTSAAFNAGPKIVCGSTLQRLANKGDWPHACRELMRWVYAGGIKLRGLVRRRQAEMKMCLGEGWR